MLNKLVEWITGCSLVDPSSHTWTELIKAIVCYIARLSVLATLVYILAREGWRLTNAL